MASCHGPLRLFNANYVETFLVTGANGENSISASAAGQAEAWHRAAEQARSLGMLGRSL